MADDGSDGDITLTERQRIRKESKLGNFIEAALTYASGATIYMPYHAYLLFWTGDSLNTPQAQADTWSQWVLVTIFYLAVNAIAAVEGTKAKYTSRTLRMSSLRHFRWGWLRSWSFSCSTTHTNQRRCK